MEFGKKKAKRRISRVLAWVGFDRIRVGERKRPLLNFREVKPVISRVGRRSS